MYNKILKYLFFLSLFGLIFTSCQKEELIQTNGEEKEIVEVITTDEDEIVLGEEFVVKGVVSLNKVTEQIHCCPFEVFLLSTPTSVS